MSNSSKPMDNCDTRSKPLKMWSWMYSRLVLGWNIDKLKGSKDGILEEWKSIDILGDGDVGTETWSMSRLYRI
jgi:hypothetical protein